MLNVHFHPPASHCIPVHPTSQVQVSGAVQFPPFWQGLVQVAEKEELKIMIHHTHYVRQSTNSAIQHTETQRHTPTPLSTGLAGSTV